MLGAALLEVECPPSRCPVPATCLPCVPAGTAPLAKSSISPHWLLAEAGSSWADASVASGEGSWHSGCICLLAGYRICVGVSHRIPRVRKPEDTASYACHSQGVGVGAVLPVHCGHSELSTSATHTPWVQITVGAPMEVLTSPASAGIDPGSVFL